FGPVIARRLRQCRPRPSNRWHLDEMVVRIAGERDLVPHGRDERVPFPTLKEYELSEFSWSMLADPLITSAISRSKAAPRGRSSFKTGSRARLHKCNARRRYALCPIEGRRQAREHALARNSPTMLLKD